jgi:hypothetical protein
VVQPKSTNQMYPARRSLADDDFAVGRVPIDPAAIAVSREMVGGINDAIVANVGPVIQSEIRNTTAINACL